MKAISPLFIFVTAFFAVYVEASFDLLRNVAGAQVDLLPALIVYAALTHGIEVVALLALGGGLWFDSLSANPMGVSIWPLFVVGLVVYRFRALLLREHTYAQFVMGLAASAAVPLLTLLILLSLDARPIFGWGSLWQWFVMMFFGGLATPLCFGFFDRMQRAFAHATPPETSFRPDRESKHGRRTW